MLDLTCCTMASRQAPKAVPPFTDLCCAAVVLESALLCIKPAGNQIKKN